MPAVLREGTLRFDVDARLARRWDGSAAFTKGVSRLAGTKACDFCAVLHANDQPVLIEVTDYRGHRLGTRGEKHVLRSGELAREVADKVRDSLAGLLWACARKLDARDEPAVEAVTRRFVNRASDAAKILVVLWLEDERCDPRAASALGDTIRAVLVPFLAAKVVVTNRRLEQRSSKPLDWLTVTERA